MGAPTDDSASFDWVSDAKSLVSLAAALADRDWIGFDSESNSGFAYEERLCLLQFADGERLWLVDLVRLRAAGSDLGPLRDVLDSPWPRICLHGGEFDVGCLKRDFKIQLRGVWDTQQAATFLGWERTGYAAVVERICGVTLPKKYSLHDWSRRPIDGEALLYALNDVKHLLDICRELRRQVEAADLEEELAIACRAVEEATWNGGFQADGMWSIKGAKQLSPLARSLLVVLYEWRDRVARELDLPPGRTLNNRLLVLLSRNPPCELGDLRRLGVPRRIVADWGSDLLSVLAAARRHPAPVGPPARRARPERQALERGERLKRWRRHEALRRGVPAQVVLPVVALRHLQEFGAADLPAVPQLGDKRIRLYAEKLCELCRTETGASRS